MTVCGRDGCERPGTHLLKFRTWTIGRIGEPGAVVEGYFGPPLCEGHARAADIQKLLAPEWAAIEKAYVDSGYNRPSFKHLVKIVVPVKEVENDTVCVRLMIGRGAR